MMNYKLMGLLLVFVAIASVTSVRGEVIVDKDFDYVGTMMCVQEAMFGNSSGSVIVSDSGYILEGSARKYKSIWNYAYNMYGYAGTRNGIACTSSSLSGLSQQWLFHSFSDGTGANVCDSMVTTFRMPFDYEEGTNISLEIAWTSSATSGNVAYGAGLNYTSNGDIYVNPTYLWNTEIATAPETSYGRNTQSIVFDGTALKKDDDIGVVIYRHGDSVSDTMTGTALVSSIQIKYISNVHGEDL